MSDSAPIRKHAASLVRGFYSGTETLANIFDVLRECQDPDVLELLDLVEHEPAVGSFFGVSMTEYANYMREIESLIAHLESSEGEHPSTP